MRENMGDAFPALSMDRSVNDATIYIFAWSLGVTSMTFHRTCVTTREQVYFCKLGDADAARQQLRPRR